MIPWFLFFSLISAHAAPTFSSINDNIIKASCVSCHSGAEPKGNIDLTSYEKIISSGVVVKFKPFESKLYLVVDSGEMPPEGASVPPPYVEDLFKWIKEGANGE